MSKAPSRHRRFTREGQVPLLFVSHDDAHARKGSLLLEAIIAIGVFAIFLAGIGMSLILGERSTVSSGDHARAAFIAEQQIEALKQMRTANFSYLATGTRGVALTKSGSGWTFSGSSVLKNGYRSKVIITSHATDWVDVQSYVSWNFGQTRSGSVTLTTSFTNWRKTVTIGNWAAASLVTSLQESGTPDFQKMTISGNYAYVTGTKVSGGKGLYVYDITNPASPARVASAFDLGAGAYGIAVSGNRLYLATDNATQEVQVYDITSPTTLASGNLVNSYDTPGSGKARSIQVYGNNVFVGLLDNPPNNQFYSLLMSETGPMTLQDSMSMSGSVLDIALQDGYAYVADSYNVGEFQVLDIYDPTNLTYAPGVGIDLTDVQDGNAIATFGTSALIGRLNGGSIDELSLYSIAESPVPVPPPGPWTLDTGGDVNAIASVYGSKYAFIGANNNNTQVEVLDMVKFTLSQAPVVKTFNTHAAIKGLFYDWLHDRLYAISANTLFVYAPG